MYSFDNFLNYLLYNYNGKDFIYTRYFFYEGHRTFYIEYKNMNFSTHCIDKDY